MMKHDDFNPTVKNMTDISLCNINNNKHVLQLEISGYKADSQNSELFVLSNTTETATLTIVCSAIDNAFAFRVQSEFSNALNMSCAQKKNNKRNFTKSQIVCMQIFSLEQSPHHWLAVYVDASCVRVFGKGRFECYFFDSMQNFFKFGGFPSNEAYNYEVPLSNDLTLTLLVTSLSHNSDRVRYLLEASCSQDSTPASLTYAYITELVKERAFCVLALFARRLADLLPTIIDNEQCMFRTSSSNNKHNLPGSPRRSHLTVLDSQNNRIRTSRHKICQSSDAFVADECEVDVC